MGAALGSPNNVLSANLHLRYFTQPNNKNVLMIATSFVVQKHSRH